MVFTKGEEQMESWLASRGTATVEATEIPDDCGDQQWSLGTVKKVLEECKEVKSFQCDVSLASLGEGCVKLVQYSSSIAVAEQ
jgi:hypothetical protein